MGWIMLETEPHVLSLLIVPQFEIVHEKTQSSSTCAPMWRNHLSSSPTEQLVIKVAWNVEIKGRTRGGRWVWLKELLAVKGDKDEQRRNFYLLNGRESELWDLRRGIPLLCKGETWRIFGPFSGRKLDLNCSLGSSFSVKSWVDFESKRQEEGAI